MSERKPVPIQSITARGLCPVCGKASYSLTGMHPQCAVTRADAVSRAARQAAGTEVKKAPARKSWCKPCPKCKREIPARRFVCDCGHQFAALMSTVEGEAKAAKPEAPRAKVAPKSKASAANTHR